MIVSRTPFRISFFGGGTDYPSWYLRHGGAVLGTTINKYCYLTCRYLPPFFEHRIRILYSKIETCQTVDEIAHPAVRETLRFLNFYRGVEIHHDGDLPARSGMGTSSAFTVGLLHALRALCGQMPTKRQLAMDGIHVEQDLLRETVGSQDQVLSAYGGFNHLTFADSGEISVRPITVPRAQLQALNSHLLLFYTGIARTASDMAKSYVDQIDSRHSQLRILNDMVEEGIEILNGSGDLDAFGRLLHEAWVCKRSLSPAVSNPAVEGIYDRAREAGAIGGKLLGAGGGGFMLLFVPPERQLAVKAELCSLIHVPFQFEFSGSQIIFYDPQEDFAAAERERQTQPVEAFREMMVSAGKVPLPRDQE